MKRILKFNNIPIWNLMDLQREFSPLAAYEQMQSFCYFAGVHCMTLPLLLQRERKEGTERYAAKYFTKIFWKNILDRKEWPKANSAVECMNRFVKECYEKEMGGSVKEGVTAVQGDSIKAAIEKEIADAKLNEKLKHICESGKFGKRPQEIRKAITLLAICEIAEMNALTQTFIDTQDGTDEGSADGSIGKKGREITVFPYDKNAALTTSDEPYKYWYHDEDTLKEGTQIQTVCIKAQPGINHYAVVTIELYEKKNRKCVQRVTLKQNEYRYCNVSDGKIIKFLPSASISGDLCLVRKDYTRGDYEVLAPNEDAWNLNQSNICCTASGSRDTGFLLLANGKVSTAFYKPAKDYMVQLQFDMIMANVVEIQITNQGYDLLLEDGTVVSNGRHDPKKRVSLNPDSRLPVPTTASKEITEIVLSEDGTSLVALREKKTPNICFGGKGFRVKKENDAVIVEL